MGDQGRCEEECAPGAISEPNEANSLGVRTWGLKSPRCKARGDTLWGENSTSCGSKVAPAAQETEGEERIVRRAYARVGLLGNPSDGYFGKTLSFALANFYADVTLTPSDRVRILPGADSQNCPAAQSDGAAEFASLHEMDFEEEGMRAQGHGRYERMDARLLPPLHLIIAHNPSDSGKVHSSVRQRWQQGDELVRAGMQGVAQLAAAGRAVLMANDTASLAALINQNFDLRRQMFGDEVLGAVNLDMVQVARSVGAAAKFTGSGGAVVAFCQKLREVCRDLVVEAEVAPAVE